MLSKLSRKQNSAEDSASHHSKHQTEVSAAQIELEIDADSAAPVPKVKQVSGPVNLVSDRVAKPEIAKQVPVKDSGLSSVNETAKSPETSLDTPDLHLIPKGESRLVTHLKRQIIGLGSLALLLLIMVATYLLGSGG